MPVLPVLLAAAFATLWVAAAQAQSPWPAPPAPAGASPWPSTGNAAPAAAPAASSPFPPAGTNASPFPGPGAAGPGPSPFGQPQRQQQPPAVCNDFVPIKDAAEKGALAIRSATGRKAPAPELCPLFRNYNSTEAKMLKFMTEHKSTCGVPDQVIAQVKASYTKTSQITKQVCNPQAAGPGRPKPPSLGDALGTPAVPTGDNTKTGKGGTYDTLSGSNPLAR